MRSLLRFCLLCIVFPLAICPAAWCADKLTAPELIALAKAQSPELRAGIEGTFDAKQLREGTAWVAGGRSSSLLWRLRPSHRW